MSFLDYLAQTRNTETVADGVKALIHLYYAEYTDATEIDPADMNTLRRLEDLINQVSPAMFSLPELIQEAEETVNEYRCLQVRTADAYEDDDDD